MQFTNGDYFLLLENEVHGQRKLWILFLKNEECKFLVMEIHNTMNMLQLKSIWITTSHLAQNIFYNEQTQVKCCVTLVKLIWIQRYYTEL